MSHGCGGIHDKSKGLMLAHRLRVLSIVWEGHGDRSMRQRDRQTDRQIDRQRETMNLLA